MRRLALIALLLVVAPMPAAAHVGSPDVFFEGNAGPYSLFVAVRVPQVIPGIAEIEVRSASADVREVTVVPMRLTGPGSRLPPTPDRADRSSADPKFFTASLWLMERGSMQVRIAVDGARGPGQLAVPVPAFAQRTLQMPRSLGGLLFGLMAVLALALVSILLATIREATLAPGVTAPRRRVVVIVVAAGVVGLIALGNAWWNAEASQYERMVLRPWRIAPRVDGCAISIPRLDVRVLPDHGHDMHLFVIREPALDRLAHVHPARGGNGDFAGALPSLPAGHYRVYADVVLESGFPITGMGTIELPDLTCAPPAGDDSVWAGSATSGPAADLRDGARLIWDRPVQLRAGVALSLAFHAVAPDGKPAELEPYMGMAGHAEIMRRDGSVFAHIHPNGSVAMPALELAQSGLHGAATPGMHHQMPALPPDLAFPYGFPQPGDYRIFVQIKRAGAIESGAFDVHVDRSSRVSSRAARIMYRRGIAIAHSMSMRTHLCILMLMAAMPASALAQRDNLSPERTPSRPLQLTSEAFAANQAIPAEYTCDGARITPPLTWTQTPPETRSIAILMEDPDEPNGDQLHWLVTGIDPTSMFLPPGTMPPGASTSKNDKGEKAYLAPCASDRGHHYVFHVYALDTALPAAIVKDVFLGTVGKHILAQGTLPVTYGKPDPSLNVGDLHRGARKTVKVPAARS